jgi:hypothetical protein
MIFSVPCAQTPPANQQSVNSLSTHAFLHTSCACCRYVADGFFYYGHGYNGQCSCATDNCSQRARNSAYSIYRIAPGAPAVGLDVEVAFADVGLAANGARPVDVMDIWEGVNSTRQQLSFTAKNISTHGVAFLRLSPSAHSS